MKHTALSLCGAMLLVGANAAAQQDPDYSTNNFFRVVSTAKDPITNRNYPWPPVQPPGYAAAPGVAAGTRGFIHCPPLRSQTGHQGTTEYIVTGFQQAIFVGSANNNTPVTNHYQFATGIGPARPSTTQPAPVYEHDPAAPDVIFVASGAVTIPPVTTIYEHNFKLTTPIPVAAKTPLLLFVEFKGGEYQLDPNGGQTHGTDWHGGHWLAASSVPFSGWTVGAQGNRTISWVPAGNMQFRTKIGLYIREALLTAAGDHSNRFYTPRLAGEYYRGLSAATAPYSSDARSNLFFDVRAGSAYASGGSAVVFFNVGPTSFPGLIPTAFGNLFLNPGDPYFGFFAGNILGLGSNGEYTGEATPLPVGALGAATVGLILKFQGLVFNPGITNVKLTSASAIQIY